MLAPPITSPAELDAALRRHGHAVLDPQGLATLARVTHDELNAWLPCWDRLLPDAYLRDGGRYRHRRHACYIVDGERLTHAPRRAHWQPLDYNALHGGIERWFEPIEPAMDQSPAWARLLAALAGRAGALRGTQPWFVEAHPFRIDTEGGIGRPTPEGAHRDGVDLVAVLLVARSGIKGGETRVFDAGGPQGLRFTLTEPWTTLLLDDARVIHESTPIQPIQPIQTIQAIQGIADTHIGHRDTLVLTFRSGGFQGP